MTKFVADYRIISSVYYITSRFSKKNIKVHTQVKHRRHSANEILFIEVCSEVKRCTAALITYE